MRYVLIDATDYACSGPEEVRGFFDDEAAAEAEGLRGVRPGDAGAFIVDTVERRTRWCDSKDWKPVP